MQHGQHYGKALPDQVDRIANLFDAHLGLVSDVREIHREQAAIEREYAAKLQALARRAAEKRSRTEASFVLGDEPTKAWDENTLKRSTLDSAYGAIVNSLVNTAQDHINVADTLTTQVVDVLKAIEKKNEDLKKKELQFFQKLLSNRDRIYSDRVKYDDECSEVESHRLKQSRAQDDRHAERASRQAEQQKNDMLNSKNVYIISTTLANRAKAKFYDEDLPGLEDELQSRLTMAFVQVLQHSQGLQQRHLDILKSRLAAVESALGSVNPAKDEDLFIEHNIRAFALPGDWVFEPCSIRYDTPDMSVEPGPKVFLQNKLAKCRTKLQELDPLVDSKRKDYDQLTKIAAARDADRALGSTDEIINDYFDARQQLTVFSTSQCILRAEADTIVSALGGDEGGRMPHTFKSSSFSIPTQCGYCKSSIWGLSKQGKTCKLCGLSVHNKCELKIPANCQESDGPTFSPTSTRSSAPSRESSLMASSTNPSASSLVRETKEDAAEEAYPQARVQFDFVATSEFELGVTDGLLVHVLEPDDGSGWVKVANANGQSGLVPASYIEAIGDEPQPPPDIDHWAVVRAIYAYVAQGADEISIKEGEQIELTSGPAGGQFYGDGWWEGLDGQGRKGIFPSNYVCVLLLFSLSSSLIFF
ncbi:hypothetical protein BDN71DRAFT_1480868 [Pleurotus eryngii]|uniref:Uncharacterized protein n=1 Tax=Pleurotus eryngii TaxID=5323 RepID=A0A9P6DIJ6_PLEER|nr:hypothetical protein BDN71DRAFT_1480868 [Pleurotus eryngii]